MKMEAYLYENFIRVFDLPPKQSVISENSSKIEQNKTKS